MDSRPNEPDLKTIAEEAGVSVSSVSRVLNNVEPVSDDVKSRVRAAVRKLGRPKQTRGSQRTSRMIYIVTPDDLNPYFYEIIHGAVAEATATRRIAAHVNVSREADSDDFFWKYVARDISLAGLIIFPGVMDDDELQQFRRQTNRPIVAMHSWHSIPEIATIKIDYVDAMKRVTQHLLQLGHERFAFVAGSMDQSANASLGIVADKVSGITRALEAAGRELPPERIIEGPPTVEFGFQATKVLLGLRPGDRPTAILGSNDLVAFGALHAARSADLAIPGDVSIVGFDDISMAPHSNPPLTTVGPPKAQMGRLAVQLINRQEADAGHAMSEYVMLESPLIVRESSGRARS